MAEAGGHGRQRRFDPGGQRLQSFLGMGSLLVGFALSDDASTRQTKYDLRSFHGSQRSGPVISDALTLRSGRSQVSLIFMRIAARTNHAATLEDHGQHTLPQKRSSGLSDYDASIAMNTETLGLNPHRDRLCVVQISPGDSSADVIRSIGDRKAPNLVSLLRSRRITKLFHYAPSTLAVLYNAFGVMAEPVFCTKIASRLTRTYTDRHGLKDYLLRASRRQPFKQQQSSGLGGRDPLSPEQLEYAASGVLYLHRLRDVLAGRLEQDGRMKEDRSLLPASCRPARSST